MPFSKKLECYFEAWIGSPLWHKESLTELRLFYQFCKAVARYSQKRPSEGDIRRRIVERWQGKLDQKYLEGLSEKYSSLYCHLWDFQKNTPFPDPDIEKDPYHLQYLAMREESRRLVEKMRSGK